MQIATWNVNSVRAREPRVLQFLERTGVDVLAMQEIKCKPEQFPVQSFEELGYKVIAHSKMASARGPQSSFGNRIGPWAAQMKESLTKGPRPEWAKRKGPETRGPDDCATETRKDGAFGWRVLYNISNA